MPQKRRWEGNKTYAMVRLEIINLLPEENRPHILAKKLDHVQ